jgi:hypothetical protein
MAAMIDDRGRIHHIFLDSIKDAKPMINTVPGTLTPPA